MAIYDIYSKRQKRARGEVRDVYEYDEIPQPLRNQILQIVGDAVGTPSSSRYELKTELPSYYYNHVNSILTKEYGVIRLVENAYSDHDAITRFFTKEKDVEKVLDVIEVFFWMIENFVATNWSSFKPYIKQEPEAAIQELNDRFKEHGVGYQYECGNIIRIDSQLVHAEVVKPALRLLGEEECYLGANDEFLVAHDHYRHKRYKECLNECLKSFESLMKSIHKKNNWEYSQNDTASKLIKSILEKELIPNYLQNQFTGLKTMLESGIPTLRNKNSGHGQGHEIKMVSEEMASYMLHLTATNLLFLAKCEIKYKSE